MILVFLFASPFASATPAFTAMSCTGTLGEIAIPTDLVVSAGQTCRLNGTHVDADVVVETGTQLFTSNNADIDGKLTLGTNASANLSQTKVEGTIEILDSRQIIVTNSELDEGAKLP